MVRGLALEDVLDQLFLHGLQRRWPCGRCFPWPFAEGFALGPAGIASGVGANDDTIATSEALAASTAALLSLLRAKFTLTPAPTLLLIPSSGVTFIRERAAIPVPGDVVGPLADHRDGLQLGLVQRQQVVLVLQEHNRLFGHLAGQQLVLVPVPGLGSVFDLGVGHHLGGSSIPSLIITRKLPLMTSSISAMVISFFSRA